MLIAGYAQEVSSSHMTALSSASWSRFSPPSNFVNEHVSTMWFMVCRWPQSQENDCTRRCDFAETIINKAVIDRTLHPPRASAACNGYSYAPNPSLRVSLAASAWRRRRATSQLVCKYDVIHKTGNIRNVSLRRQRRTEPRPWITCWVIGASDRVCSAEDIIFADRQTHRHTDKQAHHNTPLPYRGRNNNWQ